MPEIPEITSRAKEIKQDLTGKKIVNVEISAAKMLECYPRRISIRFEGCNNPRFHPPGQMDTGKTYFRMAFA